MTYLSYVKKFIFFSRILFGYTRFETKNKISIVLFIIILVVGLYIGSQVKREANKIRLNLQEMFSGKLAMNQANAQVYLNQSVLCVPNLNSNKSNDLQCQQLTINNTTVPNATEFFLNDSQKGYKEEIMTPEMKEKIKSYIRKS